MMSSTAAQATVSASTTRPLPHRLWRLTAFRFLAALWVLLFHLQGRLPITLPPFGKHFFSNGSYAMSFFFVLSGTVLAYGHFDLMPGNERAFYLARLARIYPTYLLTYLVCIPGLGVDPAVDWIRWVFVHVVSILGIQAWFPHTMIGVNGGLWSVSCEFFFYLLFPTLLPLARLIAQRGWLARAVVYVALLIGFVGLSDFAFARQNTFPIYYISPALRLPEFFLGMLIGVALRRQPASKGGRTMSPWLPAIVVTLVSVNSVYEIGLWTRANIVVVPAIAWLIYSAGKRELSREENARGPIRRACEYLGEVSYCVFLAQLPPLLWFDTAHGKSTRLATWLIQNPITAYSLAIAFVLVAAIVLHEYVELPARRRLLAWFARPAAP